MYDRIKRLLMRSIHFIIAAFTGVLLVLYGCVNGAILTRVINDFRLDTYLGVETGLSIILLLVMVVYIPIWFMISLSDRR